ncbi:MAG: hypothetical protein LBI49_02185, partial [Nocardiopsaceae bacterium]|nr:hypothetical protein [Nocardiopsaceae bacterium]
YLWARCYAEGLSKATVADLAGARRALTSERSYLRSDVPRALAKAVAGAARGKLADLLTAVALVGAVMVAAAGYLAGRTGGGRRGESGAIGRLARWADSPAAIPWAGLCLSITLWGASLAQASTGGISTSGLGLIPALPATFWAATGLLILSFCLAVMRPAARGGVLAGHLVTLVTILHATPVILYGTLRYSWSWKHIGVIDFISHHGVVFNLGGILGPYQGWPGFFTLSSFLTTGGGQSSALSYASWALPVNDLLWLGPIILITRAFTSDRRHIWTAAWLFELGNWVGQDYFSPQAFTFFLYLTVLALCLRWLWHPHVLRQRRRDGRRARASMPAPTTMRAGWRMLTRRARTRPDLTQTVPAGPLLSVDIPPLEAEDPLPDSARLALVACMFPLMVAIASSHQLTPFMLIAALTVLAVFRQVRPVLLPVLMAAITIDWILYGARPWLTANSAQLLAGLGMPLGNTSSHLVGGTQIPFDQVIVEWGARLLSAAIVVLAVAGFFRYRRYHYGPARRSWNRTALLGVAAIPSVAANSYGGEIIFRAFLFALPFMAVTAAATFFPHPAIGRGVRACLALAAVSLTLAGGFTLANYGSEAINYFTPAEVSAAQWLYRTAPAGAEIVAANSNFPWAFVHYNWYTYGFLDSPPALSRAAVRDPVDAVTRIMKQDHGQAYLILTVSQEEQQSLTGTWPPGTVARITRDLLASGKYRIAFRNRDAVVMQLSPAATSGQLGAGR